MNDASHDVVVVGSGAGGGAAAWALARAGLRVLLLEAGPRYDPGEDYRLDEPGWELDGFPHAGAPDGRQTFAPLQRLEARWSHLRSWNAHSGPMNPGERRVAWRYGHVAGLGGSTLHFTGEAHRMHPAAMGMRTRFGVAADWPMDYAALEPWYVEAERMVGVAGPAADDQRPRSAPCPLPAHSLSFASQALGAGCRKLGLGWTPNTLAILSEARDGRPPCNYCGNCARGCPRRDKGSVDQTFIPAALATGRCTVRTGVRVLRVTSGARERVSGVEILAEDGTRARVRTRALVLSCGAVETPRLLLLSADARSPDGLANESGQVGRNFMETLAWTSSALHPEPLGSHRGLPADAVCWDFNAPDAVPGVVGGCRFTPGMAEADLVGPVNYASRVVGGWGRAHKEGMRRAFGRVLSVGAIGEYLPNDGSFVDLDSTVRDKQGLPRARIHGHLDEADLRRLDFMARTAREILAASGAGDPFEEFGTYDAFNATHVFGTCRMGTSPGDSVVDPWGRSHRWRNLFVADASVFPSSGGGESPSLTIEALALRTAAHIRDLAARDDL